MGLITTRLVAVAAVVAAVVLVSFPAAANELYVGAPLVDVGPVDIAPLVVSAQPTVPPRPSVGLVVTGYDIAGLVLMASAAIAVGVLLTHGGRRRPRPRRARPPEVVGWL